MSKETLPEGQSGNSETIIPSSLARAIAVRYVKEDEKKQYGLSTMYVAFGSSHPSSFFQDQAMSAQVALLFETTIRFPGKIKSNADFVNLLLDSMSDEVCQTSIAASLGSDFIAEMGHNISPIKARKAVKGLYDVFFDMFPPIDFDGLPKQVKEAKKMGEELGVTPESVYSDNKLFEDLIRRTSSPEKVAMDALEVFDSMTGERLENFCTSTLEVFIDFLTEKTEQKFEAKKTKFIKEFSAEPKFRAMIDEQFQEYKRTRVDSLKDEISRFWGEDAFDKLPQDLRLRIKNSIILSSESLVLPDLKFIVELQVKRLIKHGFHKAVYPDMTEEEAEEKYMDDFSLPDGFIQPKEYESIFPKLLVIEPRIGFNKKSVLANIESKYALPADEDDTPRLPYAVWVSDPGKSDQKSYKIRDIIRFFEDNEAGGTNSEAIDLWLQYPEYFSRRHSIVAAGSDIGMAFVSSLGWNDDRKLMFGPIHNDATCEYLNVFSHGKDVVILGNHKT